MAVRVVSRLCGFMLCVTIFVVLVLTVDAMLAGCGVMTSIVIWGCLVSRVVVRAKLELLSCVLYRYIVWALSLTSVRTLV